MLVLAVTSCRGVADCIMLTEVTSRGSEPLGGSSLPAVAR